MIYKFECVKDDNEMELAIDVNTELALFQIKDEERNEWNHIFLTKKDVYHLIGALHLLHKEMK